ncbi:Protein ipgF precursor [Erwinia amylovora]|nr:Protein ipgF precursor [Erwinia amylovora]QJQ59209.1 Protein ipgF precursor [Erwinia amylovora]QJQ62908.1 Protein ipgF precursor [Erwinia amylovora]QJQ66710.1 Protein ipgF precursor [Erwinia amylovora]QJQ70409.1 Protein ipgF precursor [Erwinia amylovora]
MNVVFISILLTLFSPFASSQQGDCIDEAALCFQINPLLIKAIIWQESKNQQNAITRNKNNTVDVGVMQVNSIHFNTLKGMGITEQALRENSCANVFSGTWILRQVIDRHGYTWDGIGRYHSSTPVYHDKYVKNIVSIIAYKSHKIEKLIIARQNGIRDKFSCK